MANAWLLHVKSTMKQFPKLKFKDALKKAASTYKKKGSKSCGKTRKSKKSSRKRK